MNARKTLVPRVSGKREHVTVYRRPGSVNQQPKLWGRRRSEGTGNVEIRQTLLRRSGGDGNTGTTEAWQPPVALDPAPFNTRESTCNRDQSFPEQATRSERWRPCFSGRPRTGNLKVMARQWRRAGKKQEFSARRGGCEVAGVRGNFMAGD